MVPFGLPAFLRRLGAALLPVLAAAAAPAAQAAWPEKPVKLIVPYAPGGASDFVARPWANALSKAFGQPFVIDNRGGASGTIGTEAAARSPADGYTMLVAPNSALNIVPQLRKVNYDPRKDFVGIARVGDLVCGFTIVNSLPVRSVTELVAYARANPGKVAYGSSGLGTSNQMRLEMLKSRTGADILHVPYRGSADALTDLLAGQVQIMNEINVLPHVKAGKLRLIGLNYPERHPDFPDVPTLAEQGLKDADVPIAYMIAAPAATPKDVVERLNRKVVEIAGTAEMKAKLREISVAVPLQSPAQIADFLAKDFASMGALIRETGVKLE